MLWVLETDGSSRVVVGGAYIVLQSSEGLSVAQVIKFAYMASNNEAESEAESEAVLLGLRLSKELFVTNMELRCDS